MYSSVVEQFDDSVLYRLAESSLVRAWLTLPDQPAHECRRQADDWWLYNAKLGAVQFNAQSRRVTQYVRPGVALDHFVRVVEHEFLPLIYQLWGYEVLHASAVTHQDSGATLVFSGVSGSGKSTLGFGLGQRVGWRQIADDSLALAFEPDSVQIVPLPNFIHLRPASAEYYAAAVPPSLDWPARAPAPRAIYFPEQVVDHPIEPDITPMGQAQALNRLLEQLYVLDLDSRDVRRKVTGDVMALISRAPVFRLRYRKDFQAMEATLDGIESHAARL